MIIENFNIGFPPGDQIKRLPRSSAAAYRALADLIVSADGSA
jgi:hypothetical protein